MGGKGDRADLVVVLKPGISVHDRVEFHERSLTQTGRYSEDGSFRSPDGVQAVMQGEVEGRWVALIAFFPNATAKERDDLKRRLRESPFVERVVTNATLEEAIAAAGSVP